MVYGLWSMVMLFFPAVCFSWTQTDWVGGDSQFFWYDTTRYDTGVSISVDNPTGAVSMTDTGLVGYWSFNDAGSADTAYDQTSNNNDGTLVGPPTWGTVAQDTAVWGYGLGFDGSSDYVDCGSKSSLNINEAITIEAWVKPNASFGSTTGIVSNLNTGAGIGYGIQCLSSNLGFRARYSVSGWQTTYYSANPTVGVWTHLAATYNGSKVQLYINGIADNSSNRSATISLPDRALLIGKNPSGGVYFNGAIDEVRIYDRALNANEIAAHADTSIIQSLGDNSPRGVLLSSTYDADSPVVWKTIEWNNPSTLNTPYNRGDSRLRKDETNELVALWHFDEGEDLAGGTSAQDSTVYDESANENTGIVHGCVWGHASDDSAVFQSGLSFDGDGDYVNCGNVGSSRTIEFWIKTDSEDTPILELSSSDTVYISGSNIETSFGDTIIYVDGSSGYSVSAGTWHHVAITTSSAIDAANVNIGKAGSDYFLGTIDEVAIYSRAKTAEEIWQDARGTQMRFRTQTTSSILDGTGSDSPVGLWHFDNQADDPSSKDAYDSSVYGGNNGKLKDNATWSQYGVFGKCLSLDGTGDYVDCGTKSSLTPADITIEAWVKASTLGSHDGIISNMTSWGTGFSLQMGTTQNIAAMVSGAYLKTSWTPTTGVWYHIAATHDATTDLNILYVNGEEENRVTRAVTYEADPKTYIGVFYTSPWGYFDGLIDEVGIYPRAKTAKEIAIDAREGSPWSPWSPYYKNADIDDIVLFADDFNDGVIGSNWTTSDAWLIDNIADDTGVLKITVADAADTGIIRRPDNTGWYNYQVEAKVKLSATGQAGIILNWDTGTEGYVALLDLNKLRLYAMKADGAAAGAPLKTYTFSSSLTADTWYTLKAQYDGTHIRVYLGDTNRITKAVSFYDHKGHAGLLAGTTGTSDKVCFDDFKVYPIDRYCRYEATLTDNMCNDTTPYLYWVRLTYEDTTSDDSIWSRVWQDKYGLHKNKAGDDVTWAPYDDGGTSQILNDAEIDSADTVWCYNLENYDYNGNNDGSEPDGKISVFVETPNTTSYLNLRLGYRKTSALSAHSGEWPEDIDDYEWSDWMTFNSSSPSEEWNEEYVATAPGDTVVWQCTLSAANMTDNFSTEAGYILQSRAVSSDESTEPHPSSFKPDSTTKDRQDTSIIYMMRDITPPGSANTAGGVDGATSASGYTAETCANGYKNTLWTNVGVKGVDSENKNTDHNLYRDNSKYIWFNIESSADDSGIRVKVVDQNQASGRTNDCSDIDEADSSIRYRYSLDGNETTPTWNKSASVLDIDADVAGWAFADTNIWTDADGDNRYIVIQHNTSSDVKGNDDGGTGSTSADLYGYSIASIVPDDTESSTKGEKVLIQFAQKDKAGNWGYSHRAANYSATQTSGCSAYEGYYINVDLMAPKPIITAGPREANYSSSASFDFEDEKDDTPLLCAFRTLLQWDPDDDAFDNAATFEDYGWTDYQPWSPTLNKHSATFTDLDTSNKWYRCFVRAKDEALNPAFELPEDDADSAVYYFQCLTPVPNTIIYSGPAGIVTSPTSTYETTFKFKAEGGTPPYKFAYNQDGNGWEPTGAAGDEGYKTLTFSGYGNHTFRVRAANNLCNPVNGDPSDTDQTPACVTFTIEDPNKPSTIAPPSDPVKYWREESE